MTPLPANRRTPWLLTISALAIGIALIRVGHPGELRLSIALAALYAACWGVLISGFPRSGKFWGVRFVACTLAILVGFALFELPALARILDCQRLFASPAPPWQRSGNRPDPELIYLKRGQQQIRESFTGNEIHWLRDAGPSTVYRSDRRYDRDGFRNPRDFDRADVVVIGDSFVEGAHVVDSELITSRLADQLGGRKTVVNLGQAGYGPEHELHVLQRFGLPRRPGVCVWAFYEGNDLADIAEYATQRKLLEECLRSGRGITPGLVDRTFTANALGYLLRTWIDPEPKRPASRYRGGFTVDGGQRIPIFFASGDYRREPVAFGETGSNPSATAGTLGRLAEILRTARNLCDGRGTRLVVMFIPTKLRVYRNSCEFPQDSVCAAWPIDDLPRVVGELLGAIAPDLDYLDLTPHFQAEAARGVLLYLADDTHWSAAGHRSAAAAIAERIRIVGAAPRGRPL